MDSITKIGFVVGLLAGILPTGASLAAEMETSASPALDDLEAIRERGVLRLITRNSPNTYFLYRGEQMGFEYELAKGLASRLGVELEVVVAPDRTSAVNMLVAGEGDLVGSALTARDVIRSGVVFSQPYKHVSRVVLVRQGSDSIRGPEDLIGRTVWVAGGSRQYWVLRTLEVMLGGMIDIRCYPAGTAPELIIADLSAGLVNATVVDTDVASLAMSFHGNLEIACRLAPRRQPVAWGFREESQTLLSDANEYLEDIRGTFFFNHIKYRYYDSRDPFRRFQESALLAWHSGRLSKYDDHIQKHASAFGVDWLLIAALMYEESRFNPKATSTAGAGGLLQLMPRTAAVVGVANPHDPDQNIRGGIRYLLSQCELFDDVDSMDDRLRFALASYNVGAGHVRDAQRLAAEMGGDPFSWQSVSEALGLLSQREYYQRVEHGYCRGAATVRYVEDVIRRWEVYREYLKRHDADGTVDVATEAGGPQQACLSAAAFVEKRSGA